MRGLKLTVFWPKTCSVVDRGTVVLWGRDLRGASRDRGRGREVWVPSGSSQE